MIEVNEDQETVTVRNGDQSQVFPIGSAEAFAIISRAWLRAGWDTKHVYSFTWLGRPIIQLPEDMFRLQEVIYRIKPDIIIETGIAHGGTLVFYASICKAMGKGRVVGVDVEIRSRNREALEGHELFDYIDLIEGSSTDPAIVTEVASHVHSGETVLIILDSNHSKDHVRTELEMYSPLVSVGSYIVATDGIMQHLAGAPRSSEDWTWNHPSAAALDFVAIHDNFDIRPPAFLFNEGVVREPVTYWPDAWIQRLS